MSVIKLENPWNVLSIYELQYFNCPSCIYKNHSKQAFIDHAYETHYDEVIDYLSGIRDGSLSDIICPWNMVPEVMHQKISPTGYLKCKMGLLNVLVCKENGCHLKNIQMIT